MAQQEFTIKQNDTSPAIKLQLDLASGQDLTGATVRFHMAQADGTVVVDDAGSVLSATDEQIKYDWSAADTASSGVFNAEFEVTFADGSIETFPNGEYIKVTVYPDLT